MHHIQSDTKSVTSLLVGIAYDRKISPGLDNNIYEFFPEYSGTKWIDQRHEIKLKEKSPIFFWILLHNFRL